VSTFVGWARFIVPTRNLKNYNYNVNNTYQLQPQIQQPQTQTIKHLFPHASNGNIVPINIRLAQPADIPFLAWVLYTAAQSHLAHCPWSIIFNETEARTRTLLEHITQNPSLPWSDVSNFWIADADGKPAAAMCGFAPTTETPTDPVITELSIAKQVFHYSNEQLADIQKRIIIATFGFPDDIPNTWAIENVAVLPEYQGKGLIDLLFKHVLEEGRQKGFKQVQILSLIGNEQGQRSFERNGFAVITQKVHPEFENLFGTPGAKLLVQDL